MLNWLRKRRDDSFVDRPPHIIQLATTTRCNLRCVMCEHGLMKVEKKDLSRAVFEQAADYLPQAQRVDVTALGDPFLSPIFWEIVDRYPAAADAVEADFFLVVTTNGTLLSLENIDRLLSARVRTIRISIDAADAAKFRDIRGTELKPILDGVRRLLAARQRDNRQHLQIGLHMTWMRQTLEDVPPMIDLAKNLDVDFLEVFSIYPRSDATANAWVVQRGAQTFSYADNMLDNLPREQVKDLVERFHRYAAAEGVPTASFVLAEPRVSEDFPIEEWIVLFDDAHQPPPEGWKGLKNTWKQDVAWKRQSIRCPMPWLEMWVHGDGEVGPCCWMPVAQAVGNLNHDKLDVLWNGKAMQEIRRDLIDGKVPKRCDGADCPFLKLKRRASSS